MKVDFETTQGCGHCEETYRVMLSLPLSTLFTLHSPHSVVGFLVLREKCGNEM